MPTTEIGINEMSDRELLEGIYSMLVGISVNVNTTLANVAPALEGISKSPMGKMLGLK